MDAYSWFRRGVSKLKKASLSTSSVAGAADGDGNNDNKSFKNKLQQEEEELYGITDQLIEFVKSFSFETFKNFSFPDEDGSSCDGGISGNVRADLSDWQEKHAVLALSRSKELAQLRFRLCPRYLKERQFWIIYFTLVKSYVAEYELRAVRLAKLKQIRMENESVSNSSACEVEMSEAKFTTSVESSDSTEQNLHSILKFKI
ncbi:hypothetical protein CDL12_04529 [Handroanthus impetiginosus]|uniref:BSD domain-containing protein n=1 Tax=Handroanthus impetiginosus TaxID=429701 RepID=A0A2G9HZ28_9LAMI|nr:hypothetical protein CDL12_04529 [Handroanthus impetiginosus]